MGTSSSQPSPRNEEWRYVRDAYRDGIREPAEISRRIALAIGTPGRVAMAGAGPSTCLDSLLLGARGHSEDRSAPNTPQSPLQTVARLRSDAEWRLAQEHRASRYTDFALDALAVAATRALGIGEDLAAPEAKSLSAYLEEERMHELAAEFLAADIDRCFRHFIARDISEFVGSDYLPTVGQAEGFAREIADFCSRATVGAICADDESRIQDAFRRSGDEERLTIVGELLRQGISRSLDRIAGTPGRERNSRSGARGSVGPPGDDEDAAHTPALRLIEDDQHEPGRAYLPVYSLEAAVGYFGEGEPVESLGYVRAPRGLHVREGLFVVRIRGRSMEPRIPDGSYAVFRAPVVGSRQGKIVLAQQRGYHDPDTGGSYTVKRYESAKTASEDSWRHTMIRLVPENPEYEPIEIPADSADDLAIIAEFVTVMY
jgi:hypothetical protein